MQIIILGAGIAGLSTYLQLKKHLPSSLSLSPIKIRIFEAHNIHTLATTTASDPTADGPDDDEPVFTPAAIGNALGLNRNGLAVLGRLGDGVLGRVCARGNEIVGWRMSNARGWRLADLRMGSDLEPDSQSGSGSEPGSGSGVESGNSEQCDNVSRSRDLMIARQDLWEVLRDEVLRVADADGERDVISMKKVTGITIGDAHRRSVVVFDDGSSEEADLVVGADGLRSVLRRAMFDRQSQSQSQEGDVQTKTDTDTDTDTKADAGSGFGSWWWGGKQSTKVEDYVTPRYEGLGGVGGFIPTKKLLDDTTFDPKTMNIVFGPNGFFGYGCISPSPSPSSTTTTTTTTTTTSSAPGPVSAWWSTFSSPVPYPYHTHSHSQSTSAQSAKKSSFDQERALSDLLKRHKFWRNCTIQNILKHTESTGLTSIDYYPTWTTPELPCWSKNGAAVLVGDAAHALQPSSGQGASQALEDAETLALLLAHYLGHTEDGGTIHDATAIALKKYEDLRMPRLHMVYEQSQKRGKLKADMGFFMEMVMYFFIWIFSHMPDKQLELLWKYDLPREVKKAIQEDDTRSDSADSTQPS